jgi:formyltetrahydrofolate-dependent phosphoribosylglycinamide formyltransferase
MNRTPVGVLISGRGSNMSALIAAAKQPDCPYQVILVLSNTPDAPGLQIARTGGIEAIAIDQRNFPKDRDGHERALDAALRASGVEVVALAGYMRVLTPFLVGAWAGRMINIHPSLLPKYPSLDTHQRALDAGDMEAGCTVHFVTEGVDEGPVLGQAHVPILPSDDAHAISERVLAEEHRLYPAMLAKLCLSLRR